MILGIGNDLCDIRRIEKTIERYGAAKEAATKALGTGFSNGVYFSDIGVVNAPSGRPTLALTGGAARHLAMLTPKGFTARIDVTLTDEYPLAEAFVVISAVASSDAS